MPGSTVQGDWRGKTLAWVRTLIKQADPEIVEEWRPRRSLEAEIDPDAEFARVSGRGQRRRGGDRDGREKVG